MAGFEVSTEGWPCWFSNARTPFTAAASPFHHLAGSLLDPARYRICVL